MGVSQHLASVFGLWPEVTPNIYVEYLIGYSSNNLWSSANKNVPVVAHLSNIGKISNIIGMVLLIGFLLSEKLHGECHTE